MDKKTFDLLEEAQNAAARLLVNKVNAGRASAAEIAQLRAMFKDAGGVMTFREQPTRTGESVLACLDDVDPALLN